MNRAIHARLHKIERMLSPDPGDEFGLSKLSDDDLDRLLHDTLARIAANDGSLFTAAEVAAARAELDADIARNDRAHVDQHRHVRAFAAGAPDLERRGLFLSSNLRAVASMRASRLE